MSHLVRSVGAWFFDLLLPVPCMGCKVTVSSRHGFCPDCRHLLEKNECQSIASTRLVAPYRYCGPMTQAIASLKYEERSEFAARLVKTGFDSIRPLEWEGAALVPVPIHPLRLVERGYNQASLLARALGKYWKMPVIYQALVRHKFVVRQVGLGRAARAENAAHAFMLGKKSLLGRRVVLVDDVVTTGATLASCQKVLQEGGATVLGVTAVARADSQIQGYDREGVSRNEGVKSAVLGLGL